MVERGWVVGRRGEGGERRVRGGVEIRFEISKMEGWPAAPLPRSVSGPPFLFFFITFFPLKKTDARARLIN